MTTRRDLIKAGASLSAAAAASSVLLSHAQGSSKTEAAASPDKSNVARAAKPLNILILGGTGFTGPHQVRYALERGQSNAI
jgi:2'-hydroxyisoflavone reductase